MMYPVDHLATVASEDLEKSAKDYMSKLLYINPKENEYLSIPGSEKITIGLCNVVFVPLYGVNSKEKILAVFPPESLNAVGLYLLNQWWSAEDILKTADSSRTGLMEVRTFIERVVLYVLNRIIYRTKEKAEDDLPFLCHGEDAIAKILWKNGEAIGFYSVKPKGRLCDGFLTTCYQLPVMDTIFIRKCHRQNGYGTQMMEDFVASFKPDSLGLKYPLSPAMKKVCKKYLSCHPEDSKLLLEIVGVGSPFQRTPIAKKLHEIDLKGNHQIVGKLNFDIEDNDSRVKVGIIKVLETVEYTKDVNEGQQIKIKEVKDTTVTSRQNIKPVVQDAGDDSVHEYDKLNLNLQELELKNTMETVTHDVTAISAITPFGCEEQTRLTSEPTCQSETEEEQVVEMTPVKEIQSSKGNEDEEIMKTSEAPITTVPRQPKNSQHMEEVEIVKMSSETENSKERAGEVKDIEDDLEKELLPVGRKTFKFQKEVKNTKPDRDTPDEEIKNTDIIESSEDELFEEQEDETNFVTPLRCSSRLNHQDVGIEITNSVHKSSTKASKAVRTQEVKTKQASEHSEIDQVEEVVEMHTGTAVEEGIESVIITTENFTSANLISTLNNDVEDEGNVDKEQLEETITDNQNIIGMENKIKDSSHSKIKTHHAEIEVEEQEKKPVSANAFHTSKETTSVLKLPKVPLMYADANKEAQETSVSQKDVDLELHMSDSTQHRNKGKEFEVEPSEKEQDIDRMTETEHGKIVEIIKGRVEITEADLNTDGEDTAEKESAVVIGNLEEETTDANKNRDNVIKATSMVGLNNVAVVLVDFQRQTGRNEIEGNEPLQSQDVVLLTKANEEEGLVELDITGHVTEKIQHEAAVELGTNSTLITNAEQDREVEDSTLKEKSTLSRLDKNKSLKDFAEGITPAQCDRVQDSNQDEDISVYTSRNPSPRALPVNSTPKRKLTRPQNIDKETKLNENTNEEVEPVFIKHLRTRTVTVTPRKRPKHVTGTQAAEPQTEGHMTKVSNEIVTVQSAEEVKTAVEETHETNPECDVEQVPAVSESVGRAQLQDTNISENDAEEAPDGGRDMVEQTVDDKVVEITDREIVIEGDQHMRTMEKEEPDEFNQEHIKSAGSQQKSDQQKISLEDEALCEKSFEGEPSKREKGKHSKGEKDSTVNISISEADHDQSEEDVGVEKRTLRKRTITIKDNSGRKSKRLRQHQDQGENDSPVRAKEMDMTDVTSPAENKTTDQGKGQEIEDTNSIGGEMTQKDEDQQKISGEKTYGNENNSHENTVTKDVQLNEFANVSEDDIVVTEEEGRNKEKREIEPITEKIMKSENNTGKFDPVDDEPLQFENTQEEPEQSEENVEKITEASVTVGDNFILELNEEIDDNDDNTECNKVVKKTHDSFQEKEITDADQESEIMTKSITRGRKSKPASPEQSSAMRNRRVMQDSQSEMEDQAEKIKEIIGEEEKKPQQKRKSKVEEKPRRSKRLARGGIV
ncbi:titin-like [Clarias gariepinus]|uniref:titin-like n=1 Tax=Clarias gariepinus TaxID=13013 RepID=UPI00234DA954|nr:titin-like [Clarias gariepinus]XP_053336491.1 titin-like [Clarias gariepinus]